MKKFFIENLHLTVTEKCNLNCGHCFRGNKSTCSMSKEVIERSLSEVMIIEELLLGGGEPMLASESILNIIDYIVKNKILVRNVAIVTNGTIYSKEVVKALKKFSDYMIKLLKLKENSIIDIYISKDEFHDEQIDLLNLNKNVEENEKKYKVYFNVYHQYLKKIFKEGNAENLPNNYDLYNIIKKPILFGKETTGNFSSIHIGPILVINPKGIITETSTSFEHQETIYNYGNILNTSLSELMEQNGLLDWDDFCNQFDYHLNNMVSVDSSLVRKL